MSTYHRVEQGEHLSGITLKYGFADYHTIWDHPLNTELKQKRQNPNVLFPGDELFIPDREPKEFSRQTEKRHRFRVKGQPLSPRIRLEKGYNQPIAHTNCDLIVGANRCELISDGNGQIEHLISKTAVGAILIIKDTLTVKNRDGHPTKVPFDLQVLIMIGHLDPVEERSGQVARLNNLGYYREALDLIDEKELRSAVEEFQCEHNLKVDGKCGPKTQAKLKEVHGC